MARHQNALIMYGEDKESGAGACGPDLCLPVTALCCGVGCDAMRGRGLSCGLHWAQRSSGPWGHAAGPGVTSWGSMSRPAQGWRGHGGMGLGGTGQWGRQLHNRALAPQNKTALPLRGQSVCTPH